MRRRIGVAAVVVVALGVAAFLLLRGNGDDGGLEASGTVEVTDADLGFNLPGRIAEVRVREGDAVSRGEVLARLDVAELAARKEAAVARAEAERALLAELERGSRSEDVAQARAAVRAASERSESARRDLERAEALHRGGAISREALDAARTAREVAEAGMEQAREQLRALERGPREERIAAQRAAVAGADASVRQAEAALEHAAVRAPFDGRVTLRHREPGETVQPGQPVLTLMDPGDRWVRIYIPEDRIGAVAVGQPARITSDTYPDRAYAGRVSYIAREAEFTPRNVQTKEERVKLVYAVRVRIVGDEAFVLKPGVPADVVLLDPGAAPPGAPVEG
ncbi:MAG: HlyD family efflux transporter periplasmic adaptor subunit [Gemmatimonadota bacterium]|jgi:HlyD family secretion protein